MNNDLITTIANEIDEKTGEITELRHFLDTETSKQIATFEKQVKAIKEQEDLLKKQILEEMERKHIIKLENDELLISYIAPTDRETFDSKSFKQAHQDMYDEYVIMTPVKSSIRIKVKEKSEDEEKLEKIKEILN